MENITPWLKSEKIFFKKRKKGGVEYEKNNF